MQPLKLQEATSYIAMKAATPATQEDRESSPKTLIDELHERQNSHPFWSNRLLRAFKSGALTQSDLRYVFSQYYFYSRNFTRYIAALMVRCENDFFRARLSANLWDEGGGAKPEERHAQLFRDFLRDALDVAEPDAMPCDEFTAHFVSEYLNYCLNSTPLATSAFLSLGTEGIVARMYGVFAEGLKKAGVDGSLLRFFQIHMEVDDDHAVTLEQLMVSYAADPTWFETCARALDDALTLRTRFFENLFSAIQHRRVQQKLDRIQNRASLARGVGNGTLVHHNGEPVHLLYENVNERLNIAFDVLRVPFKPETLDPRIVRIAPRKNNEKHKHAHETLYYILRGSGRITVDDHVLEVSAGDLAFVPRWSLHQTENLSDTEMIVLAVTDANFTDGAFVGHQNPRHKNQVVRG